MFKTTEVKSCGATTIKVKLYFRFHLIPLTSCPTTVGVASISSHYISLHSSLCSFDAVALLFFICKDVWKIALSIL